MSPFGPRTDLAVQTGDTAHPVRKMVSLISAEALALASCPARLSEFKFTQGAEMTKLAAIPAIAAIAALPFALGPSEANAQGKQLSSTNYVTCPVGTCSKKGTAKAKDAKACSAANCPKGGPK